MTFYGAGRKTKMIFERLKNHLRYSFFHPRYLAQRELLKIVQNEAQGIHGSLLDIGCGKKPYKALFSNVNMYIGVDIPTTMHGIEEVDVVGTATCLPFKPAIFDSVLCTEVLEHTIMPLQVLQEIWNVTRVGGVLVLTVPLSEQLHEEPYDFWRFTLYSLMYLLQNSGWRVVRVYERGGAFLELGYRLSSFLYSSFGSSRDSIGRHKPHLLRGPIVVFLCASIQVCATLLDRIFPSRLSMLGYGIVAKKDMERL
jgi:SAM-dependent methyltransferase